MSLTAARYSQPSFVAIYVIYRFALPKGPASRIVVRAIRLEGALEQFWGDAVTIPAVSRDRRPLLAPGRANAVFS